MISAEIGRETTTYSTFATKIVSTIAPAETTYDWSNNVTWTVSYTEQSNRSKLLWRAKCVLILWHAPWAGDCALWLATRVWSFLARSGLPAVSRKKNFSETRKEKKELGQYPAILTSHLVNNPYIFTPTVWCKHEDMLTRWTYGYLDSETCACLRSEIIFLVGGQKHFESWKYLLLF